VQNLSVNLIPSSDLLNHGLLKVHTLVIHKIKEKRDFAGDVATPVVIKAYSHQSLKQLRRESVQEEKINK